MNPLERIRNLVGQEEQLRHECNLLTERLNRIKAQHRDVVKELSLVKSPGWNMVDSTNFPSPIPCFPKCNDLGFITVEELRNKGIQIKKGTYIQKSATAEDDGINRGEEKDHHTGLHYTQLDHEYPDGVW